MLITYFIIIVKILFGDVEKDNGQFRVENLEAYSR